MVDDVFDYLDSDEFLGDESLASMEIPQEKKKGYARRCYDRLMEEKRLKKQLDDDYGYW